MGLLLAQYEYQRAKQRVNVLQAKGLRLNNLQERYQKRIGELQKQYGKKQSQIQSKYTRLSSLISSQLSGISTRCGSYTNNTSFAGAAALMLGAFGGLGGSIAQYGLNQESVASSIYTMTMQGAQSAANADGTVDQVKGQSAFISACSSMATQLQSLLQSIITSLQQAEEEELEMAEAELEEPITQKDNELNAEVATNESMLEFQKERRDAAKAAVQDAVKNSVAHFGLGG